MPEKGCAAIIGLGFVGLPLAGLLVKRGYRVIGIELDTQKIHQLSMNKSYLSDVRDEEIRLWRKNDRFLFTVDYSAIREANFIIICVPTPLKGYDPDLSLIDGAVQMLVPHLRAGQLIILESSTYPGTTEERIKSVVEQNGFEVGKHLFLGYSPERIDPGNHRLSMEEIPKIISGITPQCLQRMEMFYGDVFRTIVPVSSTRAAEFAKLMENSQRLINISFINEMNILAHKLNINLWEVIAASSTKPIGFQPFYPGAGAGGHCIPVDPFYLSWVGLREGIPLPMIHYAGLVNEMMPHFVVSKLTDRLQQEGINLAQASVGVIGITYKKDVNDIRHSAAVKVVELLLDRGVNVSCFDPVYRKPLPFGINRFYLTAEELQVFDAVLILVDHAKIPWADVVKYSKCVIDACNINRYLMTGESGKVMQI